MRPNARTRDTQRQVLECIRDFIKDNGYSPTITEICRLMGLRSKATVSANLCALRDQGLLTWQPGCERTFVITDRAWAALHVLEAFLDSKGTARERRLTRRYFMRNVLNKPEVCAAIEDLLPSRGFSPEDAVDAHIAHIRGHVEEIRFTREGKPITVKSPPSYEALRDYMRMVGLLS